MEYHIARIRKVFIVLLLLIGSPYMSWSQVIVGADKVDSIVMKTQGLRVGITTNNTGRLSNPDKTFLIDTLQQRGVDIRLIFSPEHGLRGKGDAGEAIKGGRDKVTGLPIVSLYGKTKQPSSDEMAQIDVMLFDMQDVGCRFYTYISTLYYVMAACAESETPLIVLDRPNPNDFIDGPVMKDKKYKSFISLLPIPAVHGLTLGEAALMINGEGWLPNHLKASVSILTIEGWQHGQPYSLQTPPSPNLRSDRSIKLYPTLCFLEATTWSVGRGTQTPFEIVGYPDKRCGTLSFIPTSMIGASNPKYKGQRCYGNPIDSCMFTSEINLDYLIQLYKATKQINKRFIDRPKTFDLLAGNGALRQQIEQGWSAQKIRKSWTKDLKEYKIMRKQYLLYPTL